MLWKIRLITRKLEATQNVHKEGIIRLRITISGETKVRRLNGEIKQKKIKNRE